MTSIVRTGDVTAAMLATLSEVLDRVGDGQTPDSAGWQGAPGGSAFNGYVVLHSIPGGSLDGSIAEPDDDATTLYQVTAVGATREQCEWHADNARQALVGQDLEIDGRKTVRISVDVLTGARRDETVMPVVWISTDRFRVVTTPA